MIAIDFETEYNKDYTIKKMGADSYCRDERFNPYMVALYGEGIDYVGPTEDAPWDKLSPTPEFVAHNAAFDSLVFEAAQRKGMIPENILPLWDCSANLCVYIQAPRSLKGAAEQMLKVQPDKTVRDNMKGRTPADLSTQELKDLINYARYDSIYCLQIWEKYSKYWPSVERQIARHTMKSGQTGVYIDSEKLENALIELREKKESAEKLIPWAKQANTVASLKLLKEYCELEGIPVPKSTNQTDAECLAWESRYGDKYPVVGALGDWRKANRIIRLLETVKSRTRSDGTMAFNLKYFGAAATGRWSGDAGLNMQNLPRGEVFGVDCRSIFRARPGKKFIICDLAQIEPRVLAWLCNDYDLLNLVKKGRDIYSAHALTTMNVQRVTKSTRQLAKIRVLGLGYGCGHARFRDLAASWGYHMTENEAATTVENYRRSNTKVTNFWETCQRDMKADVGKTHTIELPSGRKIRYFNVQHKDGQLTASTTMGEHPRYWYGGKICENLVQGVARDVFTDCYYRVLKAGFNVLWTIHDELIVEVNEDDSTAKEEVEAIMSTAPEWMADCPVKAEAYEAPAYTK
ncbi:MAG: hypothetical protein CMC15_16750 [Flavobacteriaceae bacterium]|nr:hypothetical protein [Flavobacteriaceae bacterium]